MRHVIAIDQGTTGSTVLVLDEKLARPRPRLPRVPAASIPQPGWVEHDPEDDLGARCSPRSRDALRRGVDAGATIAAIGITNQRETTLLWDRATGKPRRTARSSGRTAAPPTAAPRSRPRGHEARVRERTGLVARSVLLGHEARAGCSTTSPGCARAPSAGELAFGTIDSFLVVAADRRRRARDRRRPTPRARCSSTCTRSRGSDELLALLRRAARAAARGRAVGGGLRRRPRGVPGLPDGIPIAGIAGDQQAALFGQACFAPGDAKCTYGTGAFILMNTGDRAGRRRSTAC